MCVVLAGNKVTILSTAQKKFGPSNIGAVAAAPAALAPMALCVYVCVCAHVIPITWEMVHTHGHRTDPASCRQTPYLHHLCTISVRSHTISVHIGTTLTTGT